MELLQAFVCARTRYWLTRASCWQVRRNCRQKIATLTRQTIAVEERRDCTAGQRTARPHGAKKGENVAVVWAIVAIVRQWTSIAQNYIFIYKRGKKMRAGERECCKFPPLACKAPSGWLLAQFLPLGSCVTLGGAPEPTRATQRPSATTPRRPARCQGPLARSSRVAVAGRQFGGARETRARPQSVARRSSLEHVCCASTSVLCMRFVGGGSSSSSSKRSPSAQCSLAGP